MSDATSTVSKAPWWKKLSSPFRGPTDAERTTAKALDVFRADVAAAAAADPLDRDALDTLRARPSALGLRDEDVELETEVLEGALALLDLQQAVVATGLPIVAHQHKAIGNDRCHFVASAFLASAPAQPTGRLFLTARRIVFVSTPIVALPWGAIARLADEGRDLIVAAPGRGALHQFRCNTFADARCARWIGDALRQREKVEVART